MGFFSRLHRARTAGLLLGFSTILSASFANAQSALQIIDITRASAIDLGTSSTTGTATNPKIFGGITGDMVGDCASPSATSTCSNCVLDFTAPDELACNRVRIHQNLRLRIRFKVTANISGNIFVGMNDGGTNVPLAIVDATSGTLSQNSEGFVEVTWGSICDIVIENSTCAQTTDGSGDNETGVLFVGVGPDQNTAFQTANRRDINVQILNPASDPSVFENELACYDAASGDCDDSPSAGIYAFEAFPGDEKAYIVDLKIANSCPTTFKKARVFFTSSPEEGLRGASYGSDSVDLDLDSDCEPKGDWIVDGLTNGVSYFFRISIVDIAGNNAFLNSDTAQIHRDYPAQACDDGDSTTPGDATVSPGDPASRDSVCPYIATPGSVVGLLPEDFNCFIATAAYGTGFAPKVSTLRHFRNQILLTNSVGKKITKYYYEFGPKAARFISDKPWLRAATRAALFPVWGFAWMSLHYGFFGAVIWLSILIVFFTVGLRQFRRGEI